MLGLARLSSPRRLKSFGRRRLRRGAISRLALVAVALSATAGGAGFYAFRARQGDSGAESVIYQPVKLGRYRHTVVDRGELTSSSNIEVRCYVKGRNTTGTAILQIVPEGTMVKAGDLICKLDSSALDQERVQQEILVNTSNATMIQSKNVFDLAVIAKEQYLGGEFKELEETVLAEVLVAEENVRRAEQVLEYSERMAARGYVTRTQLEADQFALENMKTQLRVAETKLQVLREFTRRKMLTQLESDIRTAEATFLANKATYELDVANLKEIEEQVAYCTITAPSDGQVVYATSQGRRDDDDPVIEEGTLVRERQVIVRLPDPSKMQVEAEINESRITLVKNEMDALIRIDAFPDLALRGKVVRVNEYPTPDRWSSTNKTYSVHVAVMEEFPGLRPGLTAEVEILVEELDDALQVPVQAVVQNGADFFCLTRKDSSLIAKPITISSSNEKYVVVSQGLESSDVVALNARRHWEAAVKPEGFDSPAQGGGPAERIAGENGPSRRPGAQSGPRAFNGRTTSAPASPTAVATAETASDASTSGPTAETATAAAPTSGSTTSAAQ